MTAFPPQAARWRLLRTPPLDGATNMALDESLLRRASRTGEWVLRVYAWERPTLSLGRNQLAAGRYDLERLTGLAIPVVRRPTGGRAILHDREVTYSVTGPVDGAGGLGDSYARINRLLVHALAGLGVAVEVAAPRAPALAPGLAPCFDLPSAGELVHAGRKLVGSAQWRDHAALLQHGAILLDGDQSLVAALLAAPVPPPPAPATLRGALGRLPSLDEVAHALEDAVRALEDPAAAPLMEDHALRAEAAELLPRYRSEEWTWRR